MSVSLAAIRVNISRIGKKAADEDQPLVQELAREIDALCEVVRQFEQECKARSGDAERKNRVTAG